MPSVSKPQLGSGNLVRVIFLVLMGLTVLVFGYLFLAVFVPVIGWYVWHLNDRVSKLEARLAPPAPKKPEGN